MDGTTIEPIQLPALISRAGQRLLDARSSAEVLEARSMAQAALHYARVTKAANDTHADCLRIIARAEIRMANEIDRGQAAGEIARPQDGTVIRDLVQGSDKVPATLPDLGVSRQRLAEWRELAEAGPEAVEGAIAEALDEGRTPTRSGIQTHIRGTFGTGDNEWYTPAEYIEAARDVLGEIDLDPASASAAQVTVCAARYFTKDDDGLSKEWVGKVWLNPPYAQPAISYFVEKMVAECGLGNVREAIMLTHNYTDTAWFHSAASIAAAICFTRGRVRFVDTGGNLASPTQGQAFFYFGNNTDSFNNRFSRVGFVVVPSHV